MADVIADTIYVLADTAIVHDIPLDAVIRSRMSTKSNMTKTNCDDARFVKGPGYLPPNIACVLTEHAHVNEGLRAVGRRLVL